MSTGRIVPAAEVAPVFLAAQWRWLVMLNYRIEPAVLQPFLPKGTELDLFDGHAYASMVGFRFLHTRVLGCAIPFHQDFDEVNLRFYVRRNVAGEWRRGVVFVKEIVPKRAIAAVARVFYNERYVALPMRHSIPAAPESGGRFEFSWRFANRWQSISALTQGAPKPITSGSEEAFIFENYWGYSVQRDATTVEYAVEHPAWRAWEVAHAALDADVAALYGSSFETALASPPHSAFVADGSDVVVRRGRTLPP